MSAENKLAGLLQDHGISHSKVHFNLAPEELYAEALSRGEGKLASYEALVGETGRFTARSRKDNSYFR